MDTLKLAGMFLKFGDILHDKNTKEEKIAFEERIIFATMRAAIPDWQPPKDWSTLSLDEKSKKLTKLRDIL